MPEKSKNTSQPPIDRRRRSSESRPGLLGVLLVVLAAGLILTGAMLLRPVGVGQTAETISENELIRAATVGGIARVEPGDDGASATQPAGAGSGVKIQKIKDQDYCPT